MGLIDEKNSFNKNPHIDIQYTQYGFEISTFRNPLLGIEKPIVSSDRTILDYPGTEGDEEWLSYWKSRFPLKNHVSYPVKYIKMNDGTIIMVWTIQPDGRYWADEGGYGWEKEKEICLYSTLNEKGEFIHPFRLYSIDGEKKDKGIVPVRPADH